MVILAVPAKVVAEQTFAIRGLITDHDGAPLEGVAVVIHETNVGTTTSPQGRFELLNIKPGHYHLHAFLIGYQQVTETVEVIAGDVELALHLDESALEIPEIVVEASLTRSDNRKSPLSIEAADAEQLRQTGSTSLAESMAYLPGVQVRNVTTGVAKPIIRGLSSNRVATVQNGIKQEGQQWGDDHGLEIDQFGLGAVEVIKGPMSFLFGSDGMAGIINIKPLPVPERGSFSADLQGYYQSNSGMWAGSAMAEGNAGGLFARVRFSQREFGDYAVPADTFAYSSWFIPIDDRRLKNTAGNERSMGAVIGVNGKWGVSQLTYSDFSQRVGFFPGAHGRPNPVLAIGDGDARNIDYPRQHIDHKKLIWNTNVLLGRHWLEADIGYQHNVRSEFEDPQGHSHLPTDSDEALKLTLQTVSANVRYHQAMRAGVKRIWGISGRGQQNRFGGAEFLLPNYQSSNAAAFVWQENTLSHHHTLSVGLRADWGQLSIEEHLHPVYDGAGGIADFTLRNPDIDRTFFTVSGAAGMAWHRHKPLNYKVNLGSSFRYPTAAELASNGTHHGAFRYERGDATLEPERGVQLDAAITFEKKRILIRTTPFANYFQRFIYLAPTGRFATEPGASGQEHQYRQANALHTGTELVVDWHGLENLHIGFVGEAAFGVNLEEQRPLPQMPPLSGTLSVEYERESDGKLLKSWSGGVWLRGALAQNLTERNEPETPAYALLDARLGFTLFREKDPWEVTLLLRNALNSVYYNHLSRYRLLNLPEPGRNFVVSVKIPLVRYRKKDV